MTPIGIQNILTALTAGILLVSAAVKWKSILG